MAMEAGFHYAQALANSPSTPSERHEKSESGRVSLESGGVSMEPDSGRIAREYLLVSDFDQTLSFNDSGIVLCDLLGLAGFEERIAGLSRIHVVQQGREIGRAQ